MTIRVWHDANPTFMDRNYDTVAQAEFILAATVATDDPNEAYRLTNTIDKYWPENEGVYAAPLHKGMKGWRSTSVGDLMETPAGHFLVASVGFRKVNVTEA